MSYTRFFGMIVTSTVIMYGLMYATAYRWSDVWFSQTRLWMALFMGSMMAVVMLAWMLNMYEDRRANVAIFAGAGALFVLGLFLARSQATVGDAAWMKAMIPHHSIAILTSERAHISDPRVRRLADDIILAQREEIAEMEALLADLDGSDVEGADLAPDVPPMEGGDEAVSGAPALTVGPDPSVGDVLLVDDVRVTSDAWLVVHPVGADGAPDVSRVVGRSFVMHGETRRVPVTLNAGAVISGDTLVVMLHDDTGEIGRFEFGASGSADPPLRRDGQPVMTSVVLPNL